MEKIHPIDLLCGRYPQLTIPIAEGARSSEEYKSVCLRGETPVHHPGFIKNDNDSIETIHTPAGDVEVLTLYERPDFEHAFMALANHCEPCEIPVSTGAVTVLGLNNWDKVRKLTVPLGEADKSLYKDVFILLSGGPYSNVSGDVFGIDAGKWLEKSIIIRKYHELTHFISRTLYPENRSAIRDEIMADMTGIIFAFGRYDTKMARIFLGIENDTYREGGRLQNYIQEGVTLEETVKQADGYIGLFEKNMPPYASERPFDVVLLFEKEKIGLKDL